MSVEQELRSWQESAMGEVADALRALLRSDKHRLAFWGGPAPANPQIEAQDAPGDPLAVAVEIASRDPLVSVCIGWIESAEGIVPHAWLRTPDGIADPARERLGAVAHLGVELRSTELGRWTPTGPLTDLAASPADRNYVP